MCAKKIKGMEVDLEHPNIQVVNMDFDNEENSWSQIEIEVHRLQTLECVENAGAL